MVGVCTEGFEAYNAVFRYCSILSNGLAPSRDIARQLSDQEGLKHRLSGGSWQRGDRRWVTAGYSVREMLVKQPVMQKLIGWTLPDVMITGAPNTRVT